MISIYKCKKFIWLYQINICWKAARKGRQSRSSFYNLDLEGLSMKIKETVVEEIAFHCTQVDYKV